MKEESKAKVSAMVLRILMTYLIGYVAENLFRRQK